MLNKNTKLELDKTEYELELLVELQIQEDKKKEKTISDMIDPTPGLFVDDQLNLENQFEYKSNDIDRNITLTKELQ